jgi:hypothetical protein
MTALRQNSDFNPLLRDRITDKHRGRRTYFGMGPIRMKIA